jgi:hypothetical protein
MLEQYQLKIYVLLFVFHKDQTYFSIFFSGTRCITAEQNEYDIATRALR